MGTWVCRAGGCEQEDLNSSFSKTVSPESAPHFDPAFRTASTSCLDLTVSKYDVFTTAIPTAMPNSCSAPTLRNNKTTGDRVSGLNPLCDELFLAVDPTAQSGSDKGIGDRQRPGPVPNVCAWR